MTVYSTKPLVVDVWNTSSADAVLDIKGVADAAGAAADADGDGLAS